LDPLRPRLRRALHVEVVALRPVRVALHHHRPVDEMRQQPLRHVRVVLQQIALRDAELLPERLAQVRQPHLTLAELQDDLVDVGRDGDALHGHARSPRWLSSSRSTAVAGASALRMRSMSSAVTAYASSLDFTTRSRSGFSSSHTRPPSWRMPTCILSRETRNISRSPSSPLAASQLTVSLS